jgi:hypothetical protein
MDFPDTLAIVAYAVAGFVAVGCGLTRGPSIAFRISCVILGAFVALWPMWVVVTGHWYLPRYWRIVPLAVPMILLGNTIAAVVRERRIRRVRELLSGAVETEPTQDGDGYPPQPPPGEVAAPHDPWKALYASLSELRPDPPTPKGATSTAAVAVRAAQDGSPEGDPAALVAAAAPVEPVEPVAAEEAAAVAPAASAAPKAVVPDPRSRHRAGEPGYHGRHRVPRRRRPDGDPPRPAG